MSNHVGRLVVVLGYSDGDRDGLHPVCAHRLAHAAAITTKDDVVVLSGWARPPGIRAEAELMAEAWAGQARELIIDPLARTTVANAANAFDELSRTEASQVVVVTSRWHAPRATAIFRWRLRNSDATVVTAVAPGGGLRQWLRELPRWAILPLQLAMRR